MYGATAGQVGLLKFQSSTNQAVCGVLPNSLFTPEFLFLTLRNMTDKMARSTEGGAQPNISQKIIQELKILLPPLSEQKAIADLLGTWDRAIEKTKELISAKEKQFKWLLKKLITNQQNNPSWQKVKLGEVIDYEQPLTML